MLIRAVISADADLELHFTPISQLEEIFVSSIYIVEYKGRFFVTSGIKLSLLHLGYSLGNAHSYIDLDAAIAAGRLSISSPIELVEPYAIRQEGNPPRRFLMSEVYYLGRGRNAWHSTWANRYDVDRISFEQDFLKKIAEGLRVPGTVFKVAQLPLLVFALANERYGICPINERSSFEYNKLLKSIDECATEYIFTCFPESDEDWLLFFKFKRRFPAPRYFRNRYLQTSTSRGSQYVLDWKPEFNERFDTFIKFTEKFKGLVRRKSRPARHC